MYRKRLSEFHHRQQLIFYCDSRSEMEIKQAIIIYSLSNALIKQHDNCTVPY